MRHTITSVTDLLASPRLLFYALPWLMLLLVAGTVAQRYLGLYASQRLFFGSFILWIGPVPAPGAYSVLLLIAASLLVKLACRSPFQRQNTGVIITHVSVLILLVGGLVTALAREEGYIVLGEGETGRTISDYRLRELAVLKNGAQVATLAVAHAAAGMNVNAKELPFRVAVLHTCYPCAPRERGEATPGLRGIARKLDIATGPSAKEEEENRAGLVLAIDGAQGDQDGTYVALQGVSEQPVVRQGADTYTFVMRPAARPLPFDVTLTHFTKDDYPGTEMAQGYRSDLTVKDGALSSDERIEMNRPLRLHGYTLYQSSFVDADGKRMSVLAVVKNAGEWFPYVAITLFCAGLLVHLIIVLRSRA